MNTVELSEKIKPNARLSKKCVLLSLIKTFHLNYCVLLLLALLPVAPLFIRWHENPVPSFHLEWLAISLGLLAWLIALPLLWRQAHLQIPRLALLPLGIMAFIAIQAQILPAVIVQHAQMAMLYLLWATLLMTLISLLTTVTSKQQISFVLAGSLTIAALSSIGIEVFYRFHGVVGWWGGLSQQNSYGDLLALGLASVLYLLNQNKATQRPYLLFALVLIVTGLSLTPSRSVWLYWLALFAITVLLQRNLFKWLMSALVLYVLLQVFWSFNPTAIFGVSTETAAARVYEQVNGSSIRLHIWCVAWQLFTQAPLLGQGLGEFDWAYFQAGQHIPEVTMRMEHAHNLILHLLAELGILPVLFLLFSFGLWLRNLLSTIKEKQQQTANAELPFYVWLLMVVAVLGIHSLLEYPLWYAQFLGVVALVLSLGETQYWSVQLKQVGKIAISLLVVIGIGIASVHEWHYAKIEAELKAYMQNQPNQLLADSHQASLQAPLLAPYIAVVYSFIADLTDEEMRKDLVLINSVSSHFWPSTILVYQQAELQALTGLAKEAQQTMALALKAYPDWRKNFTENLAQLNGLDQQKTEFLKKMAQANIVK